jgi:Mg-chelatase subunit ChlI
MNRLEEEIHLDAREATARQTYRALVRQDRPDIAVALILRAIDEWYGKGVIHGKQLCQKKK